MFQGCKWLPKPGWSSSNVAHRCPRRRADLAAELAARMGRRLDVDVHEAARTVEHVAARDTVVEEAVARVHVSKNDNTRNTTIGTTLQMANSTDAGTICSLDDL